MICRNCGWLNEFNKKVCVKCHTSLPRIDISEVNWLTRPVLVGNRQCLRFNSGWQRYTVWSLYRIRLYEIRKEDYHRFKITRVCINTPSERSVKEIIKRLQKLKYDRIHVYYICPICGEILTEIEFPMVTGDDHVCRCPVCRNEFVFGGTYPSDFKFTPLDFFSPNPSKLANNAILARIESRKKNKGEFIYKIMVSVSSDNSIRTMQIESSQIPQNGVYTPEYSCPFDFLHLCLMTSLIMPQLSSIRNETHKI